MTDVTRHEPGSFSWAELATSDTKAAKAFYSGLFGWTFEDGPMGPNPEDIYTRNQIGGKDVGALYTLRPGQKQIGVPPNWGTYFTVADVRATTHKVKPAGGTVLVEPFDVMGLGDMSVVQGPEGAVFSLWQAKQNIGFTAMGLKNMPCWTELQTNDAVKSGKFLVDVIGFKLKTGPDGEYTELQRGDTSIGGMRPMKQGEPWPPNWLIYFDVADCDATVQKAESLGGKVYMPATDIEKVGRFAILSDPQGAVFAIIKLAMG